MPKKSRQKNARAALAVGSQETLAAKLALLLAGAAPGESRIAGLPKDVPVEPIVRALAAFGAGSAVLDDARIVTGMGNGCLLEPERALDLDADPEAVCLLAGLAGAHDMETHVDCDWTAIGERVTQALQPLGRMGVQIALPARAGDPLVIRGPRAANPVDWGGHPVEPAAAAMLLLAALNTPGITTVACDAAAGGTIADLFSAFGCEPVVREDAGIMRLGLTGHRRLAPAELDLG